MKTITKILSILLALVMIIGVFAIVPFGAAAAVTYVNRTWDGSQIVENEETITSYTVLTSSITTLNSGAYVLNDDVTYSKRLNVASGANAELILVNGKTLKNDKGIIVPANATLTIYGQAADGDVKADSGIIDAYNPDGAAIGAMDEDKTGSIIIKGGTVKATGGKKDAGIGTGKNHSSGFEEIAIYGGNVTAQGGKMGAGIGAGRANSSDKGKKINIYGGTIKATGGDYGAGIGGGEDSSVDVINIYGCEKITANGGKEGAGIGSGNEENNHGTINIYGGKEITAKGGKLGAGIGGGDDGNSGTINISGGKVTARGGENAAGIGGGEDSHGENITISGGEVNACSHDGAGIGGGEDGKEGNITINGGTVKCISENAAGIGGGNKEHTKGKIIINDGTVFAVSSCGAGIGSGYWSDMESEIHINGGSVYARSGVDYDISFSDLTQYKMLLLDTDWGYCGAGIGAGGAGSQDGPIYITGGHVEAFGGGAGPIVGWGGGAGIGAGYEYGSSDIPYIGGVIDTVGDWAEDIVMTDILGRDETPDSKDGGEGGPVYITGGTVVVAGDDDACAIGYGAGGDRLEDLQIPDNYRVTDIDIDIKMKDIAKLLNGKKTFDDILQELKDGFTVVDADKRIKQCQKKGKFVVISPCDHSNKKYTLSNIQPEYYHFVDCKNCDGLYMEQSRMQSHEGNPCDLCGYAGVKNRVLLFYADKEEAEEYYVVSGAEFTLPEAPDAEVNGEYLIANGWYDYALGPNSTIYEAGESVTINCDTSFCVNYVSEYPITVDNSIEHGTLSTDVKSALQGDTITVEYKADEDYKVDTITVDGTEITPDEDGNYTFTMPDHSVTVSGTFVEKDHEHFDVETEEVVMTFEQYTTPNGGDLTESGNYFLTDDEQTITHVRSGVEVNLCLKGHTLSLPNNLVVYRDATLNIYDCTGNGEITGGGITVNRGGTVNFYGASIKGVEGKSALYIIDGGTFNMYAGKIEDNTCTSIDDGTVYISSNAHFNILGDVTISGNSCIDGDTITDSNVYLENGAKINISEELTDKTRIGVSVYHNAQLPYVFTNGLNGKGSAANFLSDNDDYFVELNSNGEAQLNSPYQLSFDANGGTGSMDPETVEGDSLYLPECEFTAPTGKQFYGWKVGDKVYMKNARVTITGNTTAYAQWTDHLYNIYVGDQRVTIENKDDILGDGTASYDPSTNTLTLTDAHIEMTEYKSGLSCGIRYNEDSNKTFTIALSGTNTIEDKIPDRNIDEMYGILQFGAAPSYTISGSGTLDIAMTANEDDVAYYGIHTRKAITVDGAEVSVDIPGTEKTVGVDLMYTYSYLTLINGAKMTINTGSNGQQSYALASNEASTLGTGGKHLYVEDTGSFFSAGSGNRAFNENIKLSEDTEARGVSVNSENSADGATAWDKESALSSYRYVSVPGKQYFVKHSLSLNGDIAVNFYLDLTEDEIDHGSEVLFELNGEDLPSYMIDKTRDAKVIDGKTLYKATCNVCAPEMADTITATLNIGGEDKEVDTYSVKKYANVILSSDYEEKFLAKEGNTQDDYDELATLVKTMLNYGAATQKQFEDEHDNTDCGFANAGIKYPVTSLKTAELSTILLPAPNKDTINAQLGGTGLSYYGYTMLLHSNTKLRFYFRKDNKNTDISGIHLTKDEVTYDAQNYNDWFAYVEVPAIPAYELNNAYMLSVNGTSLGSYSALTYVKDVLTDADSGNTLQSTVTAMYRYHEAAVDWFNDHQN